MQRYKLERYKLAHNYDPIHGFGCTPLMEHITETMNQIIVSMAKYGPLTKEQLKIISRTHKSGTSSAAPELFVGYIINKTKWVVCA